MPLKTVKTLLRVVVDHGYPVQQVLDQIGLDFNPLESSEHHVSEIPLLTYSKLYRLLMELLQDEAFGMDGSYRAPPGTFRMMSLFVIHCATLREALLRSADFFDFCDRFAQPSSVPRQAIVDLADGDVLCQFGPPRERGVTENFVTEANILYMMYRFFSWLAGSPLPLLGVQFVAPLPSNSARYAQMFGAPVSFGKCHNGIVIARGILDRPLVQSEASLKDFLRHAPYQLLSRDDNGDAARLQDRVAQMIADSSSQQLPNAEHIAAELNMSPRTLHRKLTAAGTSYQGIKDDYRRRMAIHYINRPELTINTVATLMGFQDNSAFYRSFKKWTGSSPGQYRRRLQTEARS